MCGLQQLLQGGSVHVFYCRIAAPGSNHSSPGVVPVNGFTNCRWCQEEAEEYLQYARELVLTRSKQEWTFDLSWLQENGYSIPAHLQSLCGAEIPETVETRTQSKEISERRSKFVKGGCCFQ